MWWDITDRSEKETVWLWIPERVPDSKMPKSPLLDSMVPPTPGLGIATSDAPCSVLAHHVLLCYRPNMFQTLALKS